MFKKIRKSLHDLMHNEVLKRKLYVIIFESDTPMGKAFDVALMWCIILSILLVFVESFNQIPSFLHTPLVVGEYVFTTFFTIEYVLRLYCSPQPRKYAFSFFGIVDLLATLPFYISWLFGGARYLMVIRTFRLIRVFRVFKLFSFLDEGNLLLHSLILSSRKILVFFLFVVIMVISIGTIMFMIEGDIPGGGFDNIPDSIYWAIVTMTTVGYGDITPSTLLGRFLSGIVMLMGYTIMAVPTGIVSATMIRETGNKVSDDNEYLDDAPLSQADAKLGQDVTADGEEEPYCEERYCPHCGRNGHDPDARFCKFCGRPL